MFLIQNVCSFVCVCILYDSFPPEGFAREEVILLSFANHLLKAASS